MAVSDAKKRANAKWNQENLKQFAIAFNKKNDSDVIKRLEEVPNRADYIRQLVRSDIEKNKTL